MLRMIVYFTAWLAMAGYFAAWIAPSQSVWRARLWTIAWLVYLAHVAAAFHFKYHWDHAFAATETARRAAELTGREAPEGIYFNHLFTLAWTIDVAWLWLAPESYRRRPSWIAATIYGFMLFMVVNAAIVFGQGPVRWLGVAALAATAVVVLRRTALAAAGRTASR